MCDSILLQLSSWDSTRTLTLTLAEDGKPLGDRIDRLLASFRRLRQRNDWKRHVTRAVATVEVTAGKDGKGNHCHLHVLWEGTFWLQRHISAEWLAATGDSKVVHVSALHSRQGAAAYVAGYVSKSSDVQKWPLDRICELADGVKGRRMFLTCGKRKPKVHDDVEPPLVRPAGPSSKLTDVVSVIVAAGTGNRHAIYALSLVPTLPPRWQRAFGVKTPTVVRPRLLEAWSALDEFAAALRAFDASTAAPPPPPPQPPRHVQSRLDFSTDATLSYSRPL